MPQVPRLLAKDWTSGGVTPGGVTLGGVTLGALAAGAIAALLMSPLAAPWTAWLDAGNAPGAAFVVVGLVLAGLGLLAGLPLRLSRRR